MDKDLHFPLFYTAMVLLVRSDNAMADCTHLSFLNSLGESTLSHGDTADATRKAKWAPSSKKTGMYSYSIRDPKCVFSLDH